MNIDRVATTKVYRMFLRGILLTFVVAALGVAIGAPTGDEKIETVDLNYYCFNLQQNEGNNKSPVLLMHGLSSSSADWKGVYEVLALETGRRVCAVDLRNHGDSPWSDRFDVEAMAADIEHFLDQKKIQKVNLIGHSLGGKIGVHFTLKNPDRVDSLVVEDMRPNSVTAEGTGLVKAGMNLLKEAINSVPDGLNEDEAKEAIIKFITKKLIDLGIKEGIEDVDGGFLQIRFVNGKWQYKMNVDAFIKALDKPEDMLIESSGLYNGPVMFIYGTKSIFDVPGDEDNIRKLFPDAKLVGVEGAGHVIHVSYREFKDEVINFLNEIK